MCCFVQVLEKLYRSKWTALDGLGALVISPTRELAYPIIDERRQVGKKHELSAGLLIGGKKVKEEQERVHGQYLMQALVFAYTVGPQTLLCIKLPQVSHHAW